MQDNKQPGSEMIFSQKEKESSKEVKKIFDYYREFINAVDQASKEFYFFLFYLSLMLIISPRDTVNYLDYESYSKEEQADIFKNVFRKRQNGFFSFASGSSGDRIMLSNVGYVAEDEDPKKYGFGEKGIKFDSKTRLISSEVGDVYMSYPKIYAVYPHQVQAHEAFVRNFGSEIVYLLKSSA